MQRTIPAAVVRMLREPVPTAADFKPTKFTPSETKAWFACHFLRFASSDFPKHHFTQRFYGQVMNTFGMIAHYNSPGFWTEYFTTTAGKVEFIDQVTHHHCFGDPAHTFSDVEREITRRLRQVDLLGLYRGRSRAERHIADQAEFARLKARFEPDGVPAQVVVPSLPAVQRRSQSSTTAAQLSFAIG